MPYPVDASILLSLTVVSKLDRLHGTYLIQYIYEIVTPLTYLSTYKHATSLYNYGCDKVRLYMQPCIVKYPPTHATTHGKIFFILLFYLYLTNILQLYIIKYNKPCIFNFDSCVINLNVYI
jgi:hypothetical protein